MSFRHALLSSLEWRIFAFLISSVVLLLNGVSMQEATIVSLEMQLALTVGHALWFWGKHHPVAIPWRRVFLRGN